MEEQKEPTFLDQVRQEREALEKTRDEVSKQIAELKELRTEEILSGRTNAGQTPKAPPVESPQDYAKRVLTGRL